MTNPNPTHPSPTTADISAQHQHYRSLIAHGAVILCPLIVLLPPRKLDFYTVGLIAVMGMGGNELAREYTGRSIMERVQARRLGHGGDGLPSERAREMQRLLREEKTARRERGRDLGRGGAGTMAGAEAREKQGEGEGGRGLIERIWMGSESEDWKAKRDAREKEALEDGRGYGGLIKDQIWEVWNWGRDGADEVKKVDEKVAEARKEERK